MTVCSHCGKENLDHYKFCLGCGGDLVAPAAKAPAVAAPAPVAAPAAFDEDDEDEGDEEDGEEGEDDDPMSTTAVDRAAAPVASIPASPVGAAGSVAAAGAAAVRATPAHVAAVQSTSAKRACPNCGHAVPIEFVFCGQCGTRVGADPAPKSAVPHTLYLNQPAPQPQVRGKLVLIRPDGSEGGSQSLVDGENMVGRTDGALFEADTYLSPRHAVFFFRGGSLYVRDAGSLNGVFVKMSGEEEIADGEVFRMGQELLRFDVIRPPQALEDGTEVMGSPNPGYWGRLSVIIGRGQDGAAFPLSGDAMVIGRERGDILFPEDGYVSGTHARLTRRLPDRRYFLADLNSSNGSFLRIRGERVLRSGTFLLLGQQLFRVQYT